MSIESCKGFRLVTPAHIPSSTLPFNYTPREGYNGYYTEGIDRFHSQRQLGRNLNGNRNGYHMESIGKRKIAVRRGIK